MELCGGNDLSQFLHVCWLYVHDVEALVLNIEVPEVDTEVVTADKGFSIAIDRDAIDMIGMSIGVVAPRYGSNNSVVVSEARKFEG